MSVIAHSVILRGALENDDTDEPKTILEIGINKPPPPASLSLSANTTTINNSVVTHIHHHTQYYHPSPPPPPPPPPPLPIVTATLHRPAPHHWLTVPPPEAIGGPPYSPVYPDMPEHTIVRPPNANWKERAKQIERGECTRARDVVAIFYT